MTIQQIIDGLSAEHLNGAEVVFALDGTTATLTVSTQLDDVIIETKLSEKILEGLDKQSVKMFVAENAFTKLLAKLTTIAL